eukprot:TRINITY_DN103_c0_g1_i1.p1 TRINITY_DN103_c0_g1~~TRINITY_DN103_c0_g1_i1.p1  ORF type:complete len:700 (-),score=220.75 TRINITY_DN103_c0_g1_i1:45-2144(-)
MSSPDFPTTFNNTATLENYAKDVGIFIFGGFGVVAIILSAVMICVFIKFCCSHPKDSQEFKKKIHLFISAGVALLAIIGCGVGWSYNKQCNDGVQTMTGSVSGLLNASDNLILTLDSTMQQTSINLDAKVNATAYIPFSNLLVPIDQVLGLIDKMQNQTNQFYFETQETADNVTIIKEELNYISEKQEDVGMSGVPSGDDIPNIDESFLTQISSANNSINDMRNTTLDVRSSVNESLSEIQSDLVVALNDTANAYHSKVDDLSDSFTDVRTQIQDINGTYSKDYKRTINSYSEQRTTVVNAILILPIVVAILSAAGVYFQMPKLLSVVCALSFIFFFWYMLIAGVNYALYIVTNGFCMKQAIIVDSILGNLNSPFTVPGSNSTFQTGAKIGELIQCDGDNTLINVFEAGFLITDLQNSISQQAANISSKANSLNFDDEYANARRDLDAFESNTTSLDFDQGKNLNEVVTKLENNTQQLSASNATATQQQYYFLGDVNYITLNTTYNSTGLAVPPHYYDASNITTLDCQDATWSDTRNQSQLCYSAAAAVQATIAVELIRNVTLTVDDIEEKVEALQENVANAGNMQGALSNDIADVKTRIATSQTMTNSFISEVNSNVAGIANVVSDGVGQLGADTNCAFVGKFYADFSNGFCKKLAPSLQVIGAMMVLGGASLFGSAILSAVSIYKIRGSSDDYDSSA